jgi:uncharacterized protein (TIGR04222 family)
MNPFDLRGPPFLGFYFFLSAVGLVMLYLAVKGSLFGRPRPADPYARRHLRDPYLLAWLRGGTRELLLTVAFSLCHRQLLAYGDAAVLASGGHEGLRAVSHPLEHAFLSHCTTARRLYEVLEDKRLVSLAEDYAAPLRESGLAADQEEMSRRRPAFLLVAGGLAAVSVFKIFVALSRGHSNILFLALMTLLVLALCWKIYASRRTAAGSRALRDQQTLFNRLRGRVERLASSGATNEAVLVAAAFGLTALPSIAYPFVAKLRKQSRNDTSSGSSWGCGSGGSSCGGGGGGCGGCGG